MVADTRRFLDDLVPEDSYSNDRNLVVDGLEEAADAAVGHKGHDVGMSLRRIKQSLVFLNKRTFKNGNFYLINHFISIQNWLKKY